jgi:hypothetical protein
MKNRSSTQLLVKPAGHEQKLHQANITIQRALVSLKRTIGEDLHSNLIENSTNDMEMFEQVPKYAKINVMN